MLADPSDFGHRALYLAFRLPVAFWVSSPSVGDLTTSGEWTAPTNNPPGGSPWIASVGVRGSLANVDVSLLAMAQLSVISYWGVHYVSIRKPAHTLGYIRAASLSLPARCTHL